MDYCEDIRILQNKSFVILSNPYNGNWIKVTKECYIHINNLIISGEFENDFLEQFDDESKKYIGSLIERMKEMGILNYTVQRRMVRADFAVTSLCNLQCKHCANSVMENIKEPKKDEIFTVCEKLSRVGIEEITLTGGEPLLRTDFEEISRFARKKFKKLYLMSNGTMINSINAEFIAELYDGISVSIDGYNESTCAPIRGKGVFKKVESAIKLLKKNNMKQITVSAVSNVYNLNEEDKFYDLNSEWGTVPIIRRYAPSGRGEINSKELFEPLIEAYKVYESKIDDSYSLNLGSSSNNGTTVCSAYVNSIYIGSDLCIYPCGALNLPEFKGDNVLEIEDLKEYFEQEEYKASDGYNKYYEIKPENAFYCRGCTVCIFCNDCPAYLYLYHKYGYLNDYCMANRTYLEGKIYGSN